MERGQKDSKSQWSRKDWSKIVFYVYGRTIILMNT